MRWAASIAVVVLVGTGAAGAADIPDEPATPIPAGSSDQVVLVNGRASAMIDVVMGAPSVPGYSARSSRYIAPAASLPLALVPASPCEQTIIAKFADGYTVHRTIDVCGGPVTIADR